MRNTPPEQVLFLKKTLEDAEEPCVVPVHECLDPYLNKDHVIKNAGEIHRILGEGGKVRPIIEGHYHGRADRAIDGIRHLTIPAMCEGEENSVFVLDMEQMIRNSGPDTQKT